jgi:tripartite-type tricarboxylate transporter receptor subunit TctC
MTFASEVENVRMSRRLSHARLFTLAAIGTLAAFTTAPALAAGYPDKQITIVVPLPAGGAADIFARAIGERFRQDWGQAVIVENKDGANTQIGAAFVARAAPDGYTLLLTPEFTMTVAPSLHQKMREVVQALQPVSGIASAPLALVAKPGIEARTLNEFVALARANPGKLSVAVPGAGSTSHLAAEMLQSQAGVRMTAVSYRGAPPAINDLSAGHVDAMMVAIGMVKELAGSDRVRLLGVGSRERLPGLPDVPVISESLPDFEATIWFGLFAPKGTPAEIVSKLNDAVQRLLADPEFTTRYLTSNNYQPMKGSAEALSAQIERETAHLGAVIRASGLPVD